MSISQEVYNFSQRYNIDSKLLQAVISVESSGLGFNPSGELKIRFEVHLVLNDYPYMLNKWFKTGERRYLDHYFKFPSSSNQWKLVHTGSQWDEYCALLTASFQIGHDSFNYISMGTFQIMGFHYKKLGFDSALQMYTFMSQSVSNDLTIGLKFIESDYNLVSALQQKDLVRFIKGYNGVSGDSVNIYLNRINTELNKL